MKSKIDYVKPIMLLHNMHFEIPSCCNPFVAGCYGSKGGSWQEASSSDAVVVKRIPALLSQAGWEFRLYNA